MIRRLLASVLFLISLSGSADAEPEARRAEGRERDLAAVFHPARVAAPFSGVGESLLLISQTASVVLVIGSFLSNLRRSDNQFEGVAGMMLRVTFIATVPLWMSMIAASSDLLADRLGQRAVLGVTTLEMDKEAAVPPLSPLLADLSRLEAQWRLESSPVRDALEAAMPPRLGHEDEWLASGWNWSRSARALSSEQPGRAPGDAAEAERAGLLHRLVWGVDSAVQASQIVFYLAESLRLLLFHLGFAVLPLLIAGLGSEGLAPASFRAMLELAGVCFWPLGWALANAGSRVMLQAALDFLQKSAASALYPKLADEGARTVALAAPFLSWSLVGLLAVVTLALCAWMIGTLAVVILLSHRASGAACLRLR